MEAKDIIQYIQNAVKTTPVKAYVKSKEPIDFTGCRVFGAGDQIVFGDYKIIKEILDANEKKLIDVEIETDRRNSAIPLLDTKNINARIEPGAIIRDGVEIGNNAVIMMGAILNIGAVIGDNTMIDMGAVLGGRATVGKNCHIGAGAVLAGVIEPPSAQPVIIEDDVLIGANAVVIEGCRVGRGAVIAAGAIVIDDVPENAVMAGIPARMIKMKDEKVQQKTGIVEALRAL